MKSLFRLDLHVSNENLHKEVKYFTLDLSWIEIPNKLANIISENGKNTNYGLNTMRMMI